MGGMGLELKTEELAAYTVHIKKYERHPLVRSVLVGDSTFAREVAVFYGYSSRLISVMGRPAVEESFGKEGSGKTGKSPLDLAAILSGFSDTPFDTGELEYSAVREAYHRWNSRSANILKAGGASVLIGGGGGVSFSKYTQNEAESAVIAAIAAVIGVVGILWMLTHPPKMPSPLQEYNRLRQAAVSADSFVQEHYRKLLLQRALSGTMF